MSQYPIRRSQSICGLRWLFESSLSIFVTFVISIICLPSSASEAISVEAKITSRDSRKETFYRKHREKLSEKITLDITIQSLEWSRNSELLAITGNEGIVQIIDLDTERIALEVTDAPNSFYFAWNPDSQYLAIIDALERLRIVEVSGQVETFDLDLRYSSREIVSNILWSPNGDHLAVLTNRHDRGRIAMYAVRVLSKETYEQVAFLDVKGAACNLNWSPDSQYLVASSPTRQSNTQVLELSTNSGVVLPGDSYPVRRVEWSPDSSYLVEVYGRSAQIFDISSRELVLKISNPEGIGGIRWSPDGERVAILTDDGKLKMISGRNLSAEALFEYSGVSGSLVTWSPDSQSVVVKTSDSSFAILDGSTGSEILHTSEPGGARLTSVEWSPTGQYISIISQDHAVTIFDAVTGESVHRIEHGSKVYDAWWSPNGQYLATSALDDFRVIEVAEH
ncbi:MAG: WD40 repeat domain-containing protein [Cyanobacteria bacterium P01_G01_bin.54]